MPEPYESSVAVLQVIHRHLTTAQHALVEQRQHMDSLRHALSEAQQEIWRIQGRCEALHALCEALDAPGMPSPAPAGDARESPIRMMGQARIEEQRA